MADSDGMELVPLGDGPSATVLAGTADDEAFALKVFPGPLDNAAAAWSYVRNP